MAAVLNRFIALVIAVVFFACAGTGARADRYTDALLHFTADSFDETIEGINGVTGSGNPLAATVVAALQDGRLLFSADAKGVFIRDQLDQLIDARTGQPEIGRASCRERVYVLV